MHTLCLLKRGQNNREVRDRRTSFRAQHPHKALCRYMRTLLQILKSNRCVDVVTQHGLAYIEFSVKDTLNCFPQESLTKLLVPLCTSAKRISKIMCKGHE